jgi:hypothetical protein
MKERKELKVTMAIPSYSPQGIKDHCSDTGAQGSKGDIGVQGFKEIQGIKGDTGLQGIAAFKEYKEMLLILQDLLLFM